MGKWLLASLNNAKGKGPKQGPEKRLHGLLTQRLTRKVPPRGWQIPNLDFCAIG